MSLPTSMTEVRAFIGYFRRMIPNFSRTVTPVINLTKKMSDWKSGKIPAKAQQSFNNLKSALCTAQVIGFSKPRGQYVLTVDASSTGLGAILLQTFEGKEKHISYWSTAQYKC